MDLLIGLGNPTRRDDGVGWEIARLLEGKKLAGLETRQYQQLGPELLEEWGNYARVMFVDASPGSGEVTIEKVEISSPALSASTHHLEPAILLLISQKLYAKSPELFLCRIPAEDFGFGDCFFPKIPAHVENAVNRIKEWLDQRSAH